MDKKQLRFPFVDQLRGFAVILMIIFHVFYDLTLLGFLKIDFSYNRYWYLFPRIIVFLFLFCVGISLSIVHQNAIKWPLFIKRGLKIVALALVISLTTYLLFPTGWIYFGTLHTIVVCSLFALPFLKYPTVSLTTGLTLFLLSSIFDLNITWIHLSHKSMDYISPFPWLGAVLLGIFVYSRGLHRWQITALPGLLAKIAFLGRHALAIYIIHQPLLYGTFLFVKKFILK